VGRLAGGVAHDFNNVLTAIVGYSDLLRDHLAGDERGSKLVEQIRSGADRAIAVTKQLLAFGRKQILSPAVLDVNAVIADLKQVAAVMMTKDVKLQVELDPHLGKVKADKAQIEQVVLNLVLNARDTMADGGVVKVKTANLTADQGFAERNPTVPAGEYVAITVQDTGSGMDEQTQAHIFEPFFSTKARASKLGWV
jgi:signal transduction histidine kinase